jgi:hypothetical protein
MHTSKRIWGGGAPGLQFPHLQIVVKKKTHIVYRKGDMKFVHDLPLTEIGR